MPTSQSAHSVPTSFAHYTEVILGIRGCQAEPCQVVDGVNRDTGEPELRREIHSEIRLHLGGDS